MVKFQKFHFVEWVYPGGSSNRVCRVPKHHILYTINTTAVMDSMDIKTCTQCRQQRPTSFFFNKAGKDAFLKCSTVDSISMNGRNANVTLLYPRPPHAHHSKTSILTSSDYLNLLINYLLDLLANRLLANDVAVQGRR